MLLLILCMPNLMVLNDKVSVNDNEDHVYPHG